MKNLLKEKVTRIAAILIMLCSTGAMAANNHVTLYETNCAHTGASTMTVDLYIVNDGNTALALNAISYGLNVNADILNGGTLTWALIPGTSDLPSVITNAFSYGYRAPVNELMLTSSTGVVNNATAPTLPVNTPVKVGTFVVTNSRNFATGTTTSFSLQATTQSGKATTGATVYVAGNTSTTGLNPSITPQNASVSVNCSTVLGTTNEIKSGNEIVAYPNPANDKITVVFNGSDASTIKLFDIAGRMVLNPLNVTQRGTNHVDIDVSNLAEGAYMLSVTDNGGVKQLKVMVNHKS